MNGAINNDSRSFLDYRAQGLKLQPPKFKPTFDSTICSSDTYSASDFLEELKENDISWITWSPLKKVYLNLSRYGSPTSLLPSSAYFAVGTTRGVVVIFNHKQFIQVALLPNNDCPTSEVTLIEASADGTHVAASLKTGDIFIWDLNGSKDESISLDGNREILPILHITEHQKVTGLGFVSQRHTALIVSSNSGTVSYHSGFRKGLWQLSYSTSKLLSSCPSYDGATLSATYPGSAKDSISDLQPVAIFSESCLSLISANKCELCYSSQLQVESDSQPKLIWSPFGEWLCLKSANALEAFRFDRIDSSTTLSVSSRVRWVSQESLQHVEWLCPYFIAVLTSSHKFIVLDVRGRPHEFFSTDLLPLNLSKPFEKSLTTFKQRLFTLTNFHMQLGEFLSWSDIILRLVQKGAYMTALRAIRFFVSAKDLPFALLRLKEESGARKHQLSQPLRNLSISSIRHVLTNFHYDSSSSILMNLLTEIILGHSAIYDGDVELSQFIELALDQIPRQAKDWFFSCLINMSSQRVVKTLSPIVLNEMLRSKSIYEDVNALRSLLFHLDLYSMDINFAIKLCQKLQLNRELIYVWTMTTKDFLTPLMDLLTAIGNTSNMPHLLTSNVKADGTLVYDYLSYVLTGRQFPSEITIKPQSLVQNTKLELCYILFNGTLVNWPTHSEEKFYTRRDYYEEPAFPYMELLLNFDLKLCLAMLNEVIEDPFFDDEGAISSNTDGESICKLHTSRQFVVDYLLDKVKTSSDNDQRILISIFIIRNIPKYPQFIRLSTQMMNKLLLLLCTEPKPDQYGDVEDCLEALFTEPHITGISTFIPYLKEKKFDRVLYLAYKRLSLPSKLLDLRLKSKKLKFGADDRLDVLRYCLSQTHSSPVERKCVVDVIRENINAILNIEPAGVIQTFDAFDPDLNLEVLMTDDRTIYVPYLREYFRYHKVEYPWQMELLCPLLKTLRKDVGESELCKLLRKLNMSITELKTVREILEGCDSVFGLLLVERLLGNLVNVIDKSISFIRHNQNSEHNERLLEFALETCAASEGEVARICWSKMLAFSLAAGFHQSQSQDDYYRRSIGIVLHELARRTVHKTPSSATPIVKDVMTRALESQDLILTKIQDLKPLLDELLCLANVERCMLQKALEIVNKSSSTIVSRYESMRRNGWSIGKNDCEICGEILYGCNIPSRMFFVWKNHQPFNFSEGQDINEVDKSSIVLFECHHGFHENCLINLGQKKGIYECLSVHC
ncbi:LADA_0C04896g1_1 [Lachancea dasiensis]|uniref:LADA_0C04896g1_1 n=1 Tax=Lachancea dasiensis TaxID=1072105 RepID=A0A1G4IZ43_9SACH|nr:LADA_0C04896g1_1 [Lachancea dasiensis]